MNKTDLIRNLENELEKAKQKEYSTFETRYDVMITDILDYIKNKSLSEQEIIQIFDNEKALVEHDLAHLMDDEEGSRIYYTNKEDALKDIEKSFLDKFKKEEW